MRIITRSIAVVLWLTPFVWFASSRRWGMFALWVPVTAVAVVLAEWTRRNRTVAP